MIRPPPRSTLFPHATPCRFSPPATPARAPAHARDIAIEWREISTLIPYARNARTHSDAQIAEIAGRIREFGVTNPVLIDPDGGIFGQFTTLPASMERPDRRRPAAGRRRRGRHRSRGRGHWRRRRGPRRSRRRRHQHRWRSRRWCGARFASLAGAATTAYRGG